MHDAPAGVTLRNVTAIAGGVALIVSSLSNVEAHATVTNTILRGGSFDLRMLAGSADLSATIDHSDFRQGAVQDNGTPPRRRRREHLRRPGLRRRRHPPALELSHG